jgi:hypothetical protein
MSGDGGFINWSPTFGHYALPQDGSIYLGTHFYRDVPEEQMTVTASDGVLVLPTLAGTNILQKHYRGSDRPLKGDKREFTIAFLADREDDFIRFEIAQSEGQVLYFCPGLYVVESFQATSGSVYRLSRPLAAGIVPGVTAGTHPVRFYVNDVETEDAAVVAGQTLTASVTGKLAIWYLPAFRVVILGYQYNIDGVNDLRVQATLSEAIV